MALLIDPDLVSEGVPGSNEVTLDLGLRTIDLNGGVGDLDATDGITMQCLYSFLKTLWKDDPNVDNLAAYDFPMVAITPEQFELVDNWTFADDTARKLIRTGGWSEIDDAGILDKQILGVVTLGNFEDNTNDTAYYQFGTDQSVDDSVDFDFAGPVNEGIETYTNVGNVDTLDFATTTTITRATGSFVTDGFKVGGHVTVVGATAPANDGTYELSAVAALTLTITGSTFTTTGTDTAALLAVDNRQAITLKNRVRDADPNGKLYGSVNLADIGITGSTTNKVERFPLSSATDLKIGETDANIDANTPYTQIVPKYFDVADYSKDIDGTTNRLFGAVIDVGTHSGRDGSFAAAGSVLTSADGGIHLSNYDGGTLTIHEGTDEGVTFPITSTTATTVTVNTTTFTATESDITYSLQRATPVVATAEEIYEKIQRELRRTTNINDLATGTVIGRTADDLLRFTGDTLSTLEINNPLTGTTDGVTIEGFDANDTNRLEFTDNTGTVYTFPFVAAGTITFNANLQNDPGPAEYWMYFTYSTRTNVTDFVLGTGSPATISSAGSQLPVLPDGSYINISGLTGADEPMNGVYVVNDVGGGSAAAVDVDRYDGATIAAVASTTVNIDEDPMDSPDATIVDDNTGADITGTIGGPSVSFTFDYDGNVQNGRTASTDAPVTLIAIGEDTAQHVVSTGTITQATGLAFSLVAGLERNYNNP